METDKLIKEVMENYPEAGRSNSLNCTGWDYKEVEFSFYDIETEKEHEVNLISLRKGLDKFLEIVQKGKYFNNGISPSLLSEGYTWDAQDCDALVQCAIFGEVIYG